MTDLLKQIAIGEDSVLELKIIEFKSDKITGPHRNGMADEREAMANTHTGAVLLGVDDKTKTILGIQKENLDTVETWLRGICNDLIEPPLDCVIRKTPVIDANGSEKIVIRIDVPRILFVHQNPGGYFRRIGSSKRQMKPEMLARLFQQRSQVRLIRFDEQTLANANPDVLEAKLRCADHYHRERKTLWSSTRIPSVGRSGTHANNLRRKIPTREDPA